MITVLKNNNEIIVRCTNEFINIQKIKEVVKTIRKIDRSNNSPCRIIIKSLDGIRFTLQGERFFERISSLRSLKASRIKIGYEK